MRAEDLSTELNLRPIEEHLHEIAAAPFFPRESIAMCVLRFPECAPRLRALLARAADGEKLSPRDERLFFVGLYILGAGRDEQSFPHLIRLLHRPTDDIDHLLGDAATQSLGQMASGMFDGNEDALFGMIVDPAIDEFIRNALMGAATFLTWEGRIAREHMVRFLERFYDERLAADEDYMWVGWLEAIAHLGLRDLVPLVRRAWDEGRVPDGVMEWHHFEEDLARAEAEPDEIERFHDAYLGYIDDVPEALRWLRDAPYFKRDPEDIETAAANDDVDDYLGEDADDDLVFLRAKPAFNPFRYVGRNDPCPCGSGKKFKRCCGG
jgi:hypothetical protein